MDLARVEKLKNEKIFTLSRQMAVEQSGTCSCACTNDGESSNATSCDFRNYNSEFDRGSDILLDRQEDI